MVCRYCGREIKNGSTFCQYCGRKTTQQSPYAANPPTDPRAAAAPKRNKPLLPILVGIVFAILVTVGAVGALSYFEILEIPIVSDFLDRIRDVPPETEGPTEMPNVPATMAPTVPKATQPVATMAPTEATQTVHVHTWEEATYTAPRTCSGCGLTAGLSLGTALTRCAVVDDSNSRDGSDIITGVRTDVAGKEYEDAVTFWVNAGEGYINTEHVVYLLAGEYDLLDGVIAISSGSNQAAAVRFVFYGDDTPLYTSGYIRGAQTENIQIDVSGIRELRVECETGENCQSYGILEAFLYVGE